MSGSMIIGYDTYHDTLHNVKAVGAVVACINQDCTKFMSIANIHSKSQQDLDDLICPVESKVLRKYHQLNGNLLKGSSCTGIKATTQTFSGDNKNCDRRTGQADSCLSLAPPTP